MSNATSAMPAGKGAAPVRDFRVIYHEPVCPDCGSSDISENDIEATDGLHETALICQDCGAAWPVACISEHLEPACSGPDAPAAPAPHLALRIDAYPPGTGPARRLYWCPSCDGYLSGTDLASAQVLHYTPGSARVITKADLNPPAVQP